MLKRKLYLLYILFFFFIPFFGMFLRNEIYLEVFSYLTYQNLVISGIVMIFIFALLFYFIRILEYKNTKIVEKFIYFFNIYRIRPLMLIGSFVFLALSIKFKIDFGLNFNHSGTSISETPSYVMVFFFVKSFYLYYILFKLHESIFNKRINVSYYNILVFLVLALAYGLSVGASLDIPPILFCMVILFGEFFKFSRSLFTKKVNLTTYFLFIIIGPCMVLIGFLNKYKDLHIDHDFFFFMIDQTLIRISNSALSYTNLFINHLFDFKLEMQALDSSLNTFLFRLNNLLNLGGSKPEIFSVMRLNYLVSYDTYTARAGASPGMLASVFYFPFFPINLIIFGAYYWIIFNRLSKPFAGVKANNIMLISLLYFVIPMFSSPIDFLLVFDIGNINLVGFIFATNLMIFRVKNTQYE